MDKLEIIEVGRVCLNLEILHIMVFKTAPLEEVLDCGRKLDVVGVKVSG